MVVSFCPDVVVECVFLCVHPDAVEVCDFVMVSVRFDSVIVSSSRCSCSVWF